MPYLIISGVVSLLLFLWLEERSLYLLFPWAYVQNFVLAWMYTSGWADKDFCQSLLILKEFLLLWLFLGFFPRMLECDWPIPLRVLLTFSAWCLARYAAAVLLQNQGLWANLWNLRIVSFPFQILTLAFVIASLRPAFAMRFIRHMAYLGAVVALIGLAIYLLAPADFWRYEVNVARYNSEVKGESGGSSALQQQLGGEDVKEQDEGLPGNARGRDEFLFLSPFRAIGTVCDAVGFGHLVAFPTLLFAFCLPQSWKTRLVLIAIVAALFFSFTRSAWIFVLLSLGFVLLRTKKYRLLAAAAAAALMACMVWTPLGKWYSETLARLSWSNPKEDHADGLVWLYKEGLWGWENVLGQGLNARVYESGYGILLVRYGIPALLLILWFFFSLYSWLRHSRLRDRPLFLVAQAAPLGMMVIMNSSYYPFSFIPYLLPWFVVGTCLAFSGERQKVISSGGELAATD